jgi:hypothetical protein
MLTLSHTKHNRQTALRGSTSGNRKGKSGKSVDTTLPTDLCGGDVANAAVLPI